MNDTPNFTVPHPGEILRETLEELGISQYRFAKSSGIDASVINGICRGKRSVSVESALRIARALGTDAQSWLNLQMLFDIDRTEREKHAELAKITVVPEAGSLHEAA